MTDHLSPMSLMRSHGLTPSKKRGQHFLTDPNVARKILEALGASATDVVVEVGAGLGALTAGLADSVGHVVAVEIDRGLAQILQDRFSEHPNVTIEASDILAIDLARLARDYKVPCVTVVGNLPYCITAPILLWIIRHAGVVEEAVVMVQAEVAERIAALPGSKAYGPLTIAVQFWCTPEILFRVSPSCFRPAPGVDSAVVGLGFSGLPRIAVDDESFYFDLVRKVFSQRRKMLKNSLLQLEGVNEDVLRTVETGTGLDLKRRPEELSLEAFAELARALGDCG